MDLTKSSLFLFRGTPATFSSSWRALPLSSSSWCLHCWSHVAAARAWLLSVKLWVVSPTSNLHFFHPLWKRSSFGIPSRSRSRKALAIASWKGLIGDWQVHFFNLETGTLVNPIWQTLSSMSGLGFRETSTLSAIMPTLPTIIPLPTPRCHKPVLSTGTTGTNAASPNSWRALIGASRNSRCTAVKAPFQIEDIGI